MYIRKNYGILDNSYLNRKRNYIEKVLTDNIRKLLADETHNFTVIVGDTTIHICDLFDCLTFDYEYNILDSYEYIIESFTSAFNKSIIDDDLSRYNKIIRGKKL